MAHDPSSGLNSIPNMKTTLSRLSCAVKVTFPMLLFFTGIPGAMAVNITQNTLYDKPVNDINDGLQFNPNSGLEITAGAGTVNIANGAGPYAVEMDSAYLWLHGGSLNSAGDLLLNGQSHIQFGGAQMGGVPASTNGYGGTLSFGNLVTSTGAGTLTSININDAQSVIVANSINLQSETSQFVQTGGTTTVAHDMSISPGGGAASGGLSVSGSAILNVGDNLTADLAGGGMGLHIADGATVNVGGDLTLSNDRTLNDINAVADNAIIRNADVHVNGDMNLNGTHAGDTALQIHGGSSGQHVVIGDNINLNASVAGNNMKTVLGNNAWLEVENNITLNSVSGANNTLYIGDALTDEQNHIRASRIIMSGTGDNKIIFNNNFSTQSNDGYVFNMQIIGDGSVEYQSGHTTLGLESDYSGDTLISGGLVTITHTRALGSNNITINTNANDPLQGLDIAGVGHYAFTNNMTGTGNTTVSGDVIIFINKNTYAGKWNITGKAATSKDLLVSDNSFGTGTINIAASGEFTAQTDAAFEFNNHLTGTGDFIADNNHNSFNFTADVGRDFSGDVYLRNNDFLLDGDNTAALTQATLHVENGNTTTVGTGTQSIGGLAFNGGKMVFGDINSVPLVKAAGNVDLSGRGTIQISNSSSLQHTPPDTSNPLMQQDEAEVVRQLVESQQVVTGAGGNLLLVDENGQAVSAETEHDVTQNGQTVAKGHYDYRLTSGSGADGMYINYGLTELELLAQGNDALTLSAEGNSGNAADLSAKVSGSGDLQINTDTAVSLSNRDNDYTGVTRIVAGQLQLANDQTLGNTSLVDMASATVLDIHGYQQTLGAIESQQGSLIDLAGGNLTVTKGGDIAGALTGSGALNFIGGPMAIHGDNTALSADITIKSGASVTLDNPRGLGTAGIDNSGFLKFNSASGLLENTLTNNGIVVLNDSNIQFTADNTHFGGTVEIGDGSQLTVNTANQLSCASIINDGTLRVVTNDDWTVQNSVAGSGGLEKGGLGIITLSQAAALYKGETNIRTGGVKFGSPEEPFTLESSHVNIYKDAVLIGNGAVAGDVTNAGTLSIGTGAANRTAGAGGAAAVSDALTINGNLNNTGTVQIGAATSGKAPGNQLVVKGDYQGSNGVINFNTVLADDSSATETLRVEGDTSGTTKVSVNNVGGMGKQTLNGIQLIQVNGHSAGRFTQQGRIVAGAYEYMLVRGNGQDYAHWFLSNQLQEDLPPDPPIDPEDPPSEPEQPPTKPEQPDPDPTPSQPTPPQSTKPVNRPEGGSYTENLAAANRMFAIRLQDSVSETQTDNGQQGDTAESSMWMHQAGSRNRSHDDSGQLKTESTQYVVMLGGDLVQWSDGRQGRGRVGVMAGYGNNHSKTHSDISGYDADGRVNGYTAGAYGAWYADEVNKTGLYVGSWAQYSWFTNSVSGEELSSEAYHAKGVSASVETAWNWKAAEFSASNGSRTSWHIQPQAQAIWMGVKAEDHREANGTRVSGDGSNALQTRLGIRSWLNSYGSQHNDNGRRLQPFIEANWIHNTQRFATRMDGETISQAGAENVGEVKIGMTGRLNTQLSLWGNVGHQLGGHGYSSTQATFGVRYEFK
ncbi:autotransporter outer membrane beta-barrel domain-containing protein [Kosakonia quasisacchari]|uniref:Autotransporter outer membrane beta-barrel domain-containing protein n=2 Tax=Kosakonia quasisacchari TaxID=2529380 RepID=A0A4R0H3F9_9ENTR|nr:autotransporter outer membrane beta-barrel domain-containing protein [Kosakonia quasisacchari]